MSIAPPTSPYERFMESSLRDRVVGSLQRRFGQRVGSDEVEDAYGHMLEKLSKMPVAEVEGVENPASWMFVGMRNRLEDRLRLHSASNVHFGDLGDANVLEDVLSDHDDVVAGSVIGREAAGERLAQVAELVWLKFSGADGQIAARILLEEAKPQAVAAELGLDPAYVSTVAHKAHQERRLLERKVKENPEFRCWRLRKHTSAYYASGEVSLALRAHWITCPKCRGAERLVREQTYAALAPLLPGAALATGGGGLLTRLLHHGARPGRAPRRLLRPAGHAGAKAGASSTQLGTLGATVTSKVAVVATVAVIGTSAAGATTVAAVRHFTHHATRRALTHTRPAQPVTPAPANAPTTKPSVAPRTAAQPQNVAKHIKRVVKHVKHVTRTKRRHRHVTAHVTKDVVTRAPALTQTATVPQTTTPAAPPVTTTTQAAPPVTHTTAPTTPSSSGSVSNPSYATPNAP
jgi:DNA-directed RNA polymerase specialized sigma24 family protein